jgi:hypothetical protein
MFDQQTRTQIANDRFEQLRAAALAPGIPLRQTLGEWLIRAGRRLASAPTPRRRSGLPHEALPRC